MTKKINWRRREFLKAGSLVAGAAALGTSALAAAQAQGATKEKHGSQQPETTGAKSVFYRGHIFFTNDLLFNTLSEAAERIFPADETGPGAIDLKAPYFIDNQLAGAYGNNIREYISGPFEAGAPGQGVQAALLRKDIFLQGLTALNAQSEKSFGKSFPELSATEKDRILKMCEEGDIPTEGFSSAMFFSLLRGAVLAGVYADPIYGGNDAMRGWEIKDFPGSQMSYADIVSSDKFIKISPVSLANG